MNCFEDAYEDAVNKIIIKPVDIQDLKNIHNHRKFEKIHKKQKFLCMVVNILCLVTFSSLTVVAAQMIQRNIFNTNNGFVVDDRNSVYDQSAIKDDDIVHNYLQENQDETEKITIESDDVIEIDSECLSFESWNEAMQVIEFPICYPENITYENLEIAYQDDSSMRGTQFVEASYVSEKTELLIRYTSYINTKKWESKHDYNGENSNQRTYTNKYGNTFSLVDNVNAANFDKHTFAVIAFEWYELEFDFNGYDEAGIYQILDTMDLSIYQ